MKKDDMIWKMIGNYTSQVPKEYHKPDEARYYYRMERLLQMMEDAGIITNEWEDEDA